MNNMLTTYQHFKGGLYIKLCEAKHTESEETLVIYASAVTGEVYARPKSMFYGQVEKENYKGPRFIVIPPFTARQNVELKVIENGKR
jgi:hypothetical protein